MQVKEKKDYPLVLKVEHVMEIMGVKRTAASAYIREASETMKAQGKLPPLHVVSKSRIPRDVFFELYGI